MATATSLALSPDSKLLITSSIFEEAAVIWDVETGLVVSRLEGHPFLLQEVAFPTRDRAVTASGDGEVRVWDVASGKTIHQLQTHPVGQKGKVRIAISIDGTQLLTGTADGVMRLWDIENGKLIREFPGHRGNVTAVAFSDDGMLGISGDVGGTVRLWNLKSGVVEWSEEFGIAVNSVCYSPTGKHFAVAGWDKLLAIYDSSTHEKQMLPFESYVDSNSVRGNETLNIPMVFTSDGNQLIVGNWDNVVRIYDSNSGKVSFKFTIPQGTINASGGDEPKPFSHPYGPYGLAVSRDNKTAFACGMKVLLRWDIDTGSIIQNYEAVVGLLGGLAMRSDGQTALIFGHYVSRVQGGKAFLYLLDLGTGLTTPIRIKNPELTGLAPSIWLDLAPVAISHDGKTALLQNLRKDTQNGNAVYVLDMDSKTLRHRLPHFAEAIAFTFPPMLSDDGKAVYTLDDNLRLKRWNSETGKMMRLFSAAQGSPITIRLSPDGSRIAAVLSKEVGENTAKECGVCVWDAETGKQQLALPFGSVTLGGIGFSPDSQQLAVAGSSGLTLWQIDTAKELWTAKTKGDAYVPRFVKDGELVKTFCYVPPSSEQYVVQMFDATTGQARGSQEGVAGPAEAWMSRLTPDGVRSLTTWQNGALTVRDEVSGTELCRMMLFNDGTWAVTDAEGRYDASNGGDVNGLHWVVGMEPVSLKQLKSRYYDPGLLAKYLGNNQEPLRRVAAFTNPKLYPSVQVSLPEGNDSKFKIHLENRGGGIGRVVVKVNGKELTADARGARVDPDSDSAAIDLDLSEDARLIPGQDNFVEVVAYNGEGYLASRDTRIRFRVAGKPSTPDPELWAIVAGVSDYRGEAIDLRYAAKDAEDFATALKLAANRLFDVSKVHFTLLSTLRGEAEQPTRENLIKALEAAKSAKPGDVLVVYLAGHGVNHGDQDGDYYYLTSSAQNAELNDPAVRQQVAISSHELTELIKIIPALKQVLILDTCASGKLIEKLTEQRSIPSSQIRALERVKDRTGVHILAGCASDAVSYEASNFAQGLLTHSLLMGMQGAALRENEFVDVLGLFSFAADRVPELANGVGGIQRPVIANPTGGGSFDIGQVVESDRLLIPLQLPRPLVLRSNFQDELEFNDTLSLSKILNEQLLAVSMRGSGSPIVFVDAAQLPNAYRIFGRYVVDGDNVKVQVHLFQETTRVDQFSVDGSRTQLDSMATEIVHQTQERLKSLSNKKP